MCQNIAIGGLIMFILVAFAGGIYEFIYRSPSDGFLFDVLLFGSPVLLLGSVAIGTACQQSSRIRKWCVRLLLGSIGFILLIHLSAFLWS